jgi:hypothetical protein
MGRRPLPGRVFTKIYTFNHKKGEEKKMFNRFKTIAAIAAMMTLAAGAWAQTSTRIGDEQSYDEPLLIRLVGSAKMKAGISPFYAGDYGGGVFGLAVKEKYIVAKKEVVTYSETNPWAGYGFNAFFDVTYAEISAGFTFGGGNPTNTSYWYNDSGKVSETEQDKNSKVGISFTSMNFGVLLKYPREMSENLTVYSAAGIEYALVLSGSTKYNKQTRIWDGKEYKRWDGRDGKEYVTDYAPKAGDFSALWIKIGAGCDYALTYKLFARPEVLYGIRLANKRELYNVKQLNEELDDDRVHAALGHGLTVKIGIGLKL